MQAEKIKNYKFDPPSLKFAIIVLFVGLLPAYDSIRDSIFLKRKGPNCLSVGVISASANRAQRDAIRAGWGRSRDICRLNFFIATNKDENVLQKVQAEGDQFKDIMLVPVAESYYNITHQTLEIMKALTIDPLATHIMKVDDDSYVRIGLLIRFLREMEKRFKGRDIFAGYLEPMSGPIRDVSSKWYMGRSDWPHDYYPTWAHGAGYILSANLARSIGNGAAALSLHGKILHLEDVSTGIWINYVTESLKKHVQMIHDTRFNFFQTCLDTDFISHYASPALQTCLAAGKNCGQCTGT